MNYIYIDGVQIIRYKCDVVDTNIRNIVNTTVNTWQPDRGGIEKDRDTQQGKKAEDVFGQYVNEYSEFVFVAYDAIRKDGFCKHAPFDGLLYKRNLTTSQQFDNCKKMILDDVTKSKNGAISKTTRKVLRDNHIYTVEIKSTKVDNRKRQLPENEQNCKDRLIQQIKNDDFFLYPHFCRFSRDIRTLSDYFAFIKKQVQFTCASEEEFLQKVFAEELGNASDIQIRIYTDESVNTWYIIGYSLAYDILRLPNIKHFNSNKSAGAIYFSRQLKNGKSVNLLFSDSRLWDNNFFPKYEFESSYQLNDYKRGVSKK